jgi:hypothetical protein
MRHRSPPLTNPAPMSTQVSMSTPCGHGQNGPVFSDLAPEPKETPLNNDDAPMRFLVRNIIVPWTYGGGAAGAVHVGPCANGSQIMSGHVPHSQKLSAPSMFIKPSTMSASRATVSSSKICCLCRDFSPCHTPSSGSSSNPMQVETFSCPLVAQQDCVAQPAFTASHPTVLLHDPVADCCGPCGVLKVEGLATTPLIEECMGLLTLQWRKPCSLQ